MAEWRTEMFEQRTSPAKNTRTAALAGGFALGMLGLAYASVPLYDMFCRATGFGGTTQRADAAPAVASAQDITVRFDANIASSLNWRFQPVQQTMTIKIGEQAMAHYEAQNLSQEVLTGTAAFNVSPPEAGVYFNKIECFCFTEQVLKPGETAQMPVVYFVDPAIMDDPDTKSIREITLSYSFYPAETKASALTSH
jgi:cytochrome c oxidase assembly protein subunit 11